MTISSNFCLFALCLFFTYCGVTEGNSQQEAANAEANAGSLKLIAMFPRFSEDQDLGMDTADDPQEYVQGILSLIAIPVVMVGLSVFLCPFWTICRCCKCCCCKKKKPKSPITKWSIYSRFLVVVGCVICMVVMAAMAYGANVDFSGALIYDQGEGAEGNLLDSAVSILAETANTTGTIGATSVDIRDGVVSAIDGVQGIINDSSMLQSGASSLIAMLQDISDLWSGYQYTTTVGSESYTFDCEFCTTIGTTTADISVSLNDSTSPVFSMLNNIIGEIETNIVDQEDTFLDLLNGLITMLNNATSMIRDAQEDVSDQGPMIEDYNAQRELAYNAIFAIPLLPIIFILFGGVLKKPMCFTLSYVCLWFACTLMWLLLAVHLPMAVLLGDTCDFVDAFDANPRDLLSEFNNLSADMVEACLTDERIVVAFGVDSLFNFTDTIEFPDLGNVTEAFDVPELNSFNDDLLNVNFSTFYVQGDAAISTINDLTTVSPLAPAGCCDWTRGNVSDLNATDFYNFNSSVTSPWQILMSLRGVMLAEAASIDAFNMTLFKIRSNMSSLTAAVDDLSAHVTNLADSVVNAEDFMIPLFDAMSDMRQIRCGNIGDAYYDTKAVMCVAVLGSLARIVIAMLVIAVVSMVGCLCTIKLVRKVEWFQLQKKDDKERKLQQSFQPNRPMVVMQPLVGNGFQQQNVAPAQPMYYNTNI